MAILYKLFSIFFKIGAICFGGGYAMISLIEKEVVGNGWLNAYEFLNIIGIAEMTPGPIAINSATFVGYKIAGVKGSLFATIGVILPSFITATLLSKFLFKKENK